jgi:hypothetical protein
MPIRNFDDLAKEMFEPIEFVLEGTKYAVTKVTAEMIQKLTEKSPKDNEIKTVCTQLAKMVGVKEDTFLHTDIRSVMGVIGYVTEEATKQVEKAAPKNPTQGEATPS